MNASHCDFQLYKKGIYDLLVCSDSKLDHSLGYGTEDGRLMKDRWGTDRRMKGYFKITHSNNKCGICTLASYPIVLTDFLLMVLLVFYFANSTKHCDLLKHAIRH